MTLSYSLFFCSSWSMTTPFCNTQMSCSMPAMPQHVHVVTGRRPPDTLQQLLYSKRIMECILQCTKGCSHLDYHFRFTSAQLNLDLATSNPLSWGGRLPSFAQYRTMHWHWNAKTICLSFCRSWCCCCWCCCCFCCCGCCCLLAEPQPSCILLRDATLVRYLARTFTVLFGMLYT